MALEERLKQRLLGGAVLVALIVIFVPMLIDEPVDSRVVADHRLPEKTALLEKPMPEILPPELPPELPPVPAANVPVAEPPPVPEPTSQPTKPAATPSATQDKRSSPTAWMVQVASMTLQENAQKLVKDLKKADLPAQMESVKVDGKTHYRVRVGPEVDFKTAERMAEKIKKNFKLAPKVLRYPE